MPADETMPGDTTTTADDGAASAAAVPFDHEPRTRIVFGPGRLGELGALAAGWGARRALVVTDPVIAGLGYAARAVASLEAAGVEARVFDAVRENPDTDDVDACLAAARELGPDTLVGLGGGSSIDAAKGCNFLLTNGGRMADYQGKGKAAGPMLPLIAVPTTAGTGSECQSFALISDAATHRKMACGDRKAAPRVALLDPELTLTQPRAVTALTGLDALVHALEAGVTRARNEVSDLHSARAFALIARNLPRVLAHPDELGARGHLQLAAAWAGLAIESSMLGAAHAAANPLTAQHGVVHGQAVAVMISAVIRHNAADPAVARRYSELAAGAGLCEASAAPAAAVEALLGAIDALLAQADLARSLAELDVPADGIPALAADAATQWTGTFNPREVGEADFAALYRAATAAP